MHLQVLSGQGKLGKNEKIGIFSKIQGEPGTFRKKREREWKVREKSGKFLNSDTIFFLLDKDGKSKSHAFKNHGSYKNISVYLFLYVVLEENE